MSNINLIITGPIHPNVDYLNYIVNKFKTIIHSDVKIFFMFLGR